MRVPEGFRMLTVEGATDLELTAKVGESLLVTGIYVVNPTEDYVTVKTGNTTVGYFRIGNGQGNHLFYPTDAEHRGNLLDLLIEKGIFSGYPVAEGETFSLDGVSAATSLQSVIYRVGAAGAFTPVMPNGSGAKEYQFCNYGKYSTTLADGENLYATVSNPVEFPAFPFDKLCPAGKSVTIHGIAISDVGVTTATQVNQQETTYVKLVKERECLFDDEGVGLVCRGDASTSEDVEQYAQGQSVLGNRSDIDQSDPLFFAEPLVFHANEELNLYVTTEVITGAANIDAVDAEICLIETVRPE